jgi:hypothetical protein
LVDGGRGSRCVGAPPIDAAHLEKIVQLSVAELLQQAREECAAFLADFWISQRARVRAAQMGDAGGRIAPHG